MIGETILHYRILEKLGEGGMGVVYLAEDLNLERKVAIKFLPRHIAGDSEERERFKIEAKAAASLSHSNIATIYAIEETDDEMFISMEYIKGAELKDKIKKERLQIDEIISIAVQVAEGLEAAHKKGIVHRDIKSQNIMISDEGKVKIMDFGLAKVLGETQITKIGTMLGTAAYISPEQAMGHEVDQRTDIWSFGVVLYEMLTGRLPFKGDYEQAIIYSILHEEPVHPDQVRGDIPKELELIALKSMLKDPLQRYQDMSEILIELKNPDIPSSPGKKVLELRVKEDRIGKLPKHINKKLIRRISIAFIMIFLIAAFFIWKYFGVTAKKEFNNRIAVLPLINISQDSTDNYFADGMTEELISQLAKISGLNVIARTSVMKYKNSGKNTAEIGEELDVGTILEGSVRTAFEKARISVQLIDVETQENIWAQDYDREIQDIFKIQNDIALSIANELKIQLLTAEKQQLGKKGTENSNAYKSYLLGKYQLNQRTPESVYNGIEFFNKAIEYDPDFALAYVGLTDCYTLIVGAAYGYLPRQDAITKANDAINKALELDPTSPEAYNSLAYLKFRLEWDWKGAEKYFKKAIDLQPGYASAYERYALFLGCLGRTDEAIKSMEKAYKLDPLSPSVSTGVGRMYHFAGYYDKAIKQYEKTLEMSPDYVEAEFALSITYEQIKMYDEAILHLKKSIELSSGRLIMIAILGRIYAKLGNIQDALKVKDELKKLQSEKEVSPFYFAVIDAALGNKKAAIDSLYKAYDEHFGILVYTTADNLFTNLLDDKRFVDLLKKMGLEK
jgi:serine/threonine protein kinase/Tfp pilus assembly protein PilF